MKPPTCAICCDSGAVYRETRTGRYVPYLEVERLRISERLQRFGSAGPLACPFCTQQPREIVHK